MKKEKGYFITFEGGEGAGKTTLIEAVLKELSSRGLQVLKTREPGGTELGEKIRSILLESKEPISPYAELSLFLASRAEHLKEVILPALFSGKIVLCDRFNDSSVAYQGEARGLGAERVESICNAISENVKPDLTFYLDLDPEEGLKRASLQGEHDRIESEQLTFHQKIRDGFLKIQRKEPKRFILIDANKSPETVFLQAITVLDSCLHLS